MQGFFDIKPTKGKGLTCQDCGLSKGCKSPKMQFTGEGNKGILVIAEAPGKREDNKGTQLIGEAGKLLRDHLDNLDIDLDNDCWKLNAVNCRPPNNRTPTTKEINCCREQVVRKTIQELQPEKIIVLGGSAIESILDGRIQMGKVSKWVGMAIPDQYWQCWIFPTYHPSYLLRNEGDESLDKIFSKQLETAIYWNELFKKERNRIQIITELDKAKEYLKKLIDKKPKFIAFDFETTGLRPYAKGHKIVCISICHNNRSAAAFPIFQDKEFLELIKLILSEHHIKKCAHNLKFEELWSRKILNCPVAGWQWDTMLGAHVMDNRSGICSLEFQTYVNFGIGDFKQETQALLKSPNTNTKNKIHEIPQKLLLERCALDSMYTFRLAKKQVKELLGIEKMKGYHLLHHGTLALADIEEYGITIDTNYYERQIKILDRKIKRVEQSIQKSDEIQVWNKNERDKFNPTSNPQLARLLFQHMKFRSVKKTKGGKSSVDDEALTKLAGKIPFVDSITKLRKLNKLKSTYLEGVVREIHNDILRPSYNLHIPETYRSSSSAPNFQNVPVRDEENAKIIRSGFISREGCQLLEVDYSGIEVRIAACLHQDPTMLDYIHNPKNDMHRDEACNLFKLKKKQVTPMIRFLVKNQFVFPQFYGSYWRQCAPNLWKSMDNENTADGIPVKDHLSDHNIDTLPEFEQQVKKCENVFWKKKFPEFAKWHDRLLVYYNNYLQAQLVTGFTCSGYMKRNKIWSYPVQGPAFHCLLWSLIELNFAIKKNHWRSRIIGQIHDSLVWNIYPDELDEIAPTIRSVMCERIRQQWDWIVVPLDIDAKISEVNGNWAEMKGFEI